MAPRRLTTLATFALLSAVLAPPRVAEAADPAPPAPRGPRLHLAARWDLGFTDLVTAEFADGSHRTIDANEGLSLQLGAALARGRASFRATAGVKASAINASNARIWYLAFPFELLGFWEVRPVRLGGGLSLTLAPRVFGDGDASGLDERFDPSLGLVLQGEWVWRTASGGSLALGPRFTWQRLRLQSTGDALGANALGLAVAWTP